MNVESTKSNPSVYSVATSSSLPANEGVREFCSLSVSSEDSWEEREIQPIDLRMAQDTKKKIVARLIKDLEASLEKIRTMNNSPCQKRPTSFFYEGITDEELLENLSDAYSDGQVQEIESIEAERKIRDENQKIDAFEALRSKISENLENHLIQLSEHLSDPNERCVRVNDFREFHSSSLAEIDALTRSSNLLEENHPLNQLAAWILVTMDDLKGLGWLEECEKVEKWALEKLTPSQGVFVDQNRDQELVSPPVCFEEAESVQSISPSPSVQSISPLPSFQLPTTPLEASSRSEPTTPSTPQERGVTPIGFVSRIRSMGRVSPWSVGVVQDLRNAVQRSPNV